MNTYLLILFSSDFSTQNLNLSAIEVTNETNADYSSLKDWTSKYTYVPMVCYCIQVNRSRKMITIFTAKS